ncbi:GspE/PulE family protein [Thalassoroseus pseudoceratinae]|uniref:GspE/PulE family protein n=1 Tax=Thalassoroseus pseudoceratinae TaxID=2713176 RepID=UPI0014212131|nr:ATPase, T2SS/T4P/T4SS family [Thalassoroseus pseudoceratinae]
MATATEPASSYELSDELAERIGTMPPQGAVEFVIDQALQVKASDLYFHPQADDVQVDIRRLGIMRSFLTLPSDNGQRCVAHIQAESGMQRTERRYPRDGHWKMQRIGGGTAEMRLHAMPTLHGDSLAIRLMNPNDGLKRLSSLGFVGQQHAELTAMLNRPGGLILVTGPSGCGKTTTLYACLHALHDGRRSIHTIESPVEYAVPGLRQTALDTGGAANMADLLRGVLRQGPDVLMIGEIRDSETADAVVNAANSGHLVLATLNAPFAGTAIQRLLKMGVPAYFLSTGLLGIISQRLVRTLDPDRRVPVNLGAAPRTFEDVADFLGPTSPENNVGLTVYASTDDDSYNGLSGVFEVFRATPATRRMIANEESSRQLTQQAVSEGMLDLRRATLIKVARGITTFDEMQRIIPAELTGDES